MDSKLHTTGPLGFIGLGKMGGAMAGRLMDCGHALRVYDPNPEAMARFIARGAMPATSPRDVATGVDMLFLCLPTPYVVHAVTLGADGIASSSATPTVVDLGTTGPVMTRRVAAGLAERGIPFADSPITGGIAGATAGTLVVMVACARETFAAIEATLGALGRVIYTGDAPGLAQTAKLANNMLSAAALAVTSEAMAMGVKAGLDPQVLLDIINAGSGRNSATEDKFPRAILPGTFDFGMSSGLFLKDVRLCVDEAVALGVPMVAGNAVRQLFSITCARFGADSDFTSIARVVEEWADVEVRRRVPESR